MSITESDFKVIREMFAEEAMKMADKIMADEHALQRKMFEPINKDLADIKGELIQINGRLTTIETRLTSLETRMGQVETRVGQVETQMTQLIRFEEIERRLKALEETAHQ